MQKFLKISFYVLLINLSFTFANERTKIDSINALDYDSITAHLLHADVIYTKNINDAKTINYKFGEGIAYSKLGLVKYLKGLYDESTESYIQAIKLLEEGNYNRDLSEIYGEFGYQLKRRDLPKANYYMRKGIQLAEKHDFRNKLDKLYNNYGVLKEFENDLDSALYFYKKSLKMVSEDKDSVGIPFSLNNIAGIYAMRNDYKNAYKYLDESDNYRIILQNKLGLAENYALRGSFYFNQDRLDDAIESFKKCLDLAKSIGYKFLIIDSYNNLKDIYKKKEDFQKAFKFQSLYETYKDSVINSETNSKIAELEIAYETERKDRLIAENEVDLREKGILVSVFAGSSFTILLVLLLVYKYQKQKRTQIAKQLEMKNQLYESELRNTIAEEKIRISKELHDNIGSQLTFMISSIDNLSFIEKEEESISRLSKIANFGRNTMKDLRNTIWAMKIENGKLQDLVFRISEMVQEINNVGNPIEINISTEYKSNVSLSSTQMLNLYRFIQEALQNSIKHSVASVITISISEIENKTILSVKDNGIGFDVNKVKLGNGIKNMNERCSKINANFELLSDKDGTSISVSIPIE